MKTLTRDDTEHGVEYVTLDDYRELERENEHLKQLRDGDNKLIMALADAAGIRITCNPKMLGMVWEQFHDGVMGLQRENLALSESVESWENTFESYGLEPDTAIKRVKEIESDHAGIRERFNNLLSCAVKLRSCMDLSASMLTSAQIKAIKEFEDLSNAAQGEGR